MTAPDINEIVKRNGIDAGRAVIDAALPWKPVGNTVLRDFLDVGQRCRKTVDRDFRAPFSFSTFDDAVAESSSKPWLLKGLLARGETSGWIGPPGSLKSALLTSVAIAVSSGEDFCGKRSKGKFSVIYFALERADLVRRRLRAHHHRDGLASLPIAVVGHVIDLMSPKTVELIVATIDTVQEKFGLPVGLIIFDTYPKAIAAGGGDEDKARDQGVAFANLQRIKDLRLVHVALVGHCGKDKSRGARGSNAWLGDADVMIEIDGSNIRTATVTKANDMAEGHLGSFQAEVVDLGPDEDGDAITVFIAVPVNAAPAPNKRPERPLTPAAKIALQALTEALQEVGETPPASNHIPAGVRTVTIERWREYAYRLGISPSNEPRARQQAFKRAWESLRAASKIGVWDNCVWIVP
jgi:AAA domain